ncbi:hypothetical protein [Halalkalibacter akibai]|uniref:Uncharacterized protein n=1 Tax=Halalkalibacter akibai (strain ATCC 43226 / DSM 21942 / CIP 109018 / JCM 9157 / 1139) TaxID=1236973 RepID=W4R229_HALA3|nr:hypothetical protein [Halalkalibacter akibai]GAE37609.1 hypothetical protein JCM9157_4926 [Halalkalibacter akibai JCM 9157]
MFIGFGKKKGGFLVNQTYLGLWMCIVSLLLFGCSGESETKKLQTEGVYWVGSLEVNDEQSEDHLYGMGEELEIVLEYIGSSEDITNIKLYFKDRYDYNISREITEFESNTIQITDQNTFYAIYTINNNYPILIEWFEGTEAKEEEIYFE